MEKGVYQQFYELEKEHWWFSGMRTLCLTLLKRLQIDNDGKGTRCLDVGCGSGLWTKELEIFGQVCGLDVAPEALHFCQERGVRRLVRATAERLPFKADSYGLITALGVIEHLEDEQTFLVELYRVCKPGGYVLFLTSAYNLLWSWRDEIVHHRRRYTKGKFGRLLTKSGFEVLQHSYANTLLFLPILLVRLGERLRGAPTLRPERLSDVFMPAPVINKFLYGLLWTEAKLLNIVNLPFGVGLLAIVRKPMSPRGGQDGGDQMFRLKDVNRRHQKRHTHWT